MQKRWIWVLIMMLGSVFAAGAQEDGRLTTGFELHQLPHDGVVAGAQWREDGETILTWAYDGQLRLWDAREGRVLQTWTVDGWAEGAVWNASGLMAWVNTPLSCSIDCVFRVFIWRNNEQSPLILSHPDRIAQATWNPPQTLIATAAADGQLRVWSVATGDLLVSMSHPQSVMGATWSPDGSQIASWALDGNLRLWDVGTGAELLALPHTGVDGAVWNETGMQFLTWGGDGNALLWDVDSGLQQATFSHDGPVTSAQWRGENIVTTSLDGTVHLWQNEETILQHDGPVWGAEWRGDRILTWSAVRDGWVAIWDVPATELLSVLPHPGLVRGAAWNPDGDRVLTWGDDGIARIWVAPRPQDCVVMSIYDRVNQRETPGGAILGQFLAGDVTLATAQGQGADDFTWWRLLDGSWVREDVVQTIGMCDQLPTVD